MALENKLEEMREKENARILNKLEQLSPKEKQIYMKAYSDALNYAHNFFEVKDRNRAEVMEDYLP